MGYLLPARGDAVRGRQTQNPERGRKQHLSSTSYADQSSGRQTQNPERGRKPAKYRLHDTTTTRRQTQNPERGRKLAPTLSV